MITISFATMQAALLCAAKKDIRPWAENILITPQGDVVTTDGAILVTGKTSEGAPDKDYMFKLSLKPPVKYDYATVDTERNTVTFVHGDIQSPIVAHVFDGTYAQWERITMTFKKADTVSVGFGTKYLTLMGKLSKLFGNAVLLETGQSNTHATRWTLNRLEPDTKSVIETVHVYLMPCRI